jgi:hypothetical protein
MRMPEPPKDFIGQMIYKAMGERGPEDFVPTILPKNIKSPRELMADDPKGHSVPAMVEKVVPVDVPKAVGDIGEDVHSFVRSLSPQNIFAKGTIDLPEPKSPQELILRPHAFSSRDVRIHAPPGLPQIPGLPGLPAPQDLIPPPPGISK